MERLTQANFDYCVECCPGETMIGCGFYKGETDVMCSTAARYNRLAAYEDTGLEPEKIDGIKALAVLGLMRDVKRASAIMDAEREGRLLVLPCKVGDTVYTAQRGVVSELFVEHFELFNVGIWVSWHLMSGLYGNFRMDGFPASDIGKTVFLTREEAEAALGKERDV